MKDNEIFRTYGKEQLESLEPFDSVIEYWNSSSEVELTKGSYDGFWQWVDEGMNIRNLVSLSALESSGYRINHTEVDTKIENMIDYNYNMARESFTENNQEELKGIEKDKINYHDLYELKKGNLAEQLSELENEYMSEDVITKEIQILYYDKDNFRNPLKGRDSCIYADITFFFDEYNKNYIIVAKKEIPVNGDIKKAIDTIIEFLKFELEKIN